MKYIKFPAVWRGEFSIYIRVICAYKQNGPEGNQMGLMGTNITNIY